jgi:hypothetical protein
MTEGRSQEELSPKAKGELGIVRSCCLRRTRGHEDRPPLLPPPRPRLARSRLQTKHCLNAATLRPTRTPRLPETCRSLLLLSATWTTSLRCVPEAQVQRSKGVSTPSHRDDLCGLHLSRPWRVWHLLLDPTDHRPTETVFRRPCFLVHAYTKNPCRTRTTESKHTHRVLSPAGGRVPRTHLHNQHDAAVTELPDLFFQLPNFSPPGGCAMDGATSLTGSWPANSHLRLGVSLYMRIQLS